MVDRTDMDKDIPWLGAWVPLSCGLVGIGALLVWVGVPLVVLMIVGPFVILGIYLALWGPTGRFTRSASEDGEPPNP